MAPVPRAQCADAQRAELRADRRDHGRIDDRIARNPGGARNWDYRYTWIRDTGFTLRALYRLGYDWEAIEYFAFILEAVRGKDVKSPSRTPDHVRDRRRAGSHRKNDRPPLGLARLQAGAGRQRRLEPAPERRVGHADRRRGLPPDRGAEQIIPSVWDGLAGFVDDAIKQPATPTRASGRSAASRSTSPSPR